MVVAVWVAGGCVVMSGLVAGGEVVVVEGAEQPVNPAVMEIITRKTPAENQRSSLLLVI